MFKALSKKDTITLASSIAATLLAAICGHERFGPIAAFATAALALSLVAVVVGHATDHLGARMSPGATGVLQSALANVPELMVCIFSLRAGLVEVVKGALVGSILANSMLVLGLAILIGGLKNGTQKFGSEPPKMMAILMLLAVSALLIPSLSHVLHSPASQHEVTFAGVAAIVLLLVFGCTLPFFLKGAPEVTPSGTENHATWPVSLAIAILTLAGVAAAYISELFVDALKPATQALGLSEAFTGLIVVAIAGNAIENLVGIQLMAKNKPDYALSVILNSSSQIALVLFPVLVLASIVFFPAATLTFALSPMLIVALVLSALIPMLIIYDGETIWLEGVALIGIYVLIATSFWWG